jgi:ribokinase
VIVVLGSANMDVVTEVSRIPRPGETVAGKRMRHYLGGKGANQAVAAARLGASVSFFGKVGRDPFGERLLEGLRADRVDVTAVESIDEEATGTASIWVEESGENAIACVPGANGTVDAAYIDRIFHRVAAADVLLLQLEIPLDTVAYLLGRLPRGRPLVILDPSPAQDASRLPLRRVDVLTPNRTELLTLTQLDDMEAAAGTLRRAGVGNVVCKVGGDGAVWFGETAHPIAALPVTVVDTTAAGDAFNGALACAITERSMIDAIRWANAAGALATTKAGAQPSLPFRADVDRLYSGALCPR